MATHVYHWKHGWIPLDHTAALSKAKGNHEKAAAMLHDAHSPDAGINSKQHVAKAALGVTHLPTRDQPAAMQQVHQAAAQHGAQDLLPQKHSARAAELGAAAQAKQAEADRIAGTAGWGDRAAGRLNAANLKQFGKSTDSQLSHYVKAQEAAAALQWKAGLADTRAKEAARVRFTHEDIKGATLVQDKRGDWHRVVKVNAKSVTVKTPHSWTDTISHDKIHAIAEPLPGRPGKVRIRKAA